MMKRATTKLILMLVAGLVLSLALQTFAQNAAETKASWKAADDAVSKEAIKAYETIKLHLEQLDYSSLAKSLADNRRPLLPKAKQTDEAVKESAGKLAKNAKDVEKSRQLLAEVDASKPRIGKAVTMEHTTRGMNVTLLKISLEGTRDLAEQHKMKPAGWTTDDEGNLAILMVKHDGEWYWNPFGW